MPKSNIRSDAAIFFDLIGTLVMRTRQGFRLLPQAKECMRLAKDYRLGVLSNAGGPGQISYNILEVLVGVGIDEYFTPELLINASLFPARLPDRRAFAAAAALAETPIRRCIFVSNDSAMRIGALAAGMSAETLSPDSSANLESQKPSGVVSGATLREAALVTDAVAGTEETIAPVFLAGEVDEDTGPTFILKGRIVTMNSAGDVHEGGRCIIERGKIAHVLSAGEPVPVQFASALELETGGTIYPGLIDLHNHFVYNALPLWAVPKRYDNRTQWPREDEYKSNVSLPIRALAASTTTARALVRYIEAKAIVAGTTTGQGIKTKVKGGIKIFHGAMRNVEETNDPRLPEAETRVPDLQNTAEEIQGFRKNLERHDAFFYHLCEGVDKNTRRLFLELLENDLVENSLVGIHALALQPEDYGTLASKGAKVVWSPFSNLLLYGRTLDVAALKQSGVSFAIGCDWSPTGSKNLLQELKVARYVAEKQGAKVTAQDLVRAVTADAAKVAAWQKYLGVLRRGALADVVVIMGDGGDPYNHLIDATEAQVQLVVVHGMARYGDRALMKRLNGLPDQPLENITIEGAAKAFQLYAPGSELNGLKVRDAQEILREAMADLPTFVKQKQDDDTHLRELRVDEPPLFTLVLDNEFEPTGAERQAMDAAFGLLAKPTDWSNIAQRIELDDFEVNTPAYWKLIEAQHNLDDELRELLKNSYGG